MSDRKRITYSFADPEAFYKMAVQVEEIVRADTNNDSWVCDKALPPTCYPPPLTTEAIHKLKELEGVVVRELDE